MLSSILLLIGLFISELISREFRLQHDVIQAGKAYFAAEAAVETALLTMRFQPIGYEGEGEKHEANLSYKYFLSARGPNVPCPNRKDKPSQPIVRTTNPVSIWRRLPLQESVALPLFIYQSEDDRAKKIQNFLVEFVVDRYLEGNDGVPDILKNSDVLRWKILAIDRATGETVALSDYYPIKSSWPFNFSEPTKFGTGSKEAAYLTTAKFYEKTESGGYIFSGNYSIQSFLNKPNYIKPYLVLTNVVTFVEELGVKGSGDIFFRLVKENPGDANFGCEYVKIQADGYSGDYRQSLDVERKLQSILPVFDFALYRTGE